MHAHNPARTCLAAVVLASAACATPAHAHLLTVTTDKPTYNPGETLHVRVTATNPDPAPLTLNFPSFPQAWYQIDTDFGTWPGPGSTVLSSVTIPPNSSHTWSFTHNWFDYNIPLGSHDLLGRLPWQTSTPATFSIVPPTFPTESFLIDFGAPADGARPATSDFWRLGVRFRSETANAAVHRPGVTPGGFLQINSATYPPGFNIIADLDVPASSATVDVSTAAGFAITLVAKDAAGNVLDTATSPPVPSYQEFLPLAVHAPAGASIASLEWWPSTPNASVLIDNLYLSLPAAPAALPEPATALCAAAALLFGARRPTRGVTRPHRAS